MSQPTIAELMAAAEKATNPFFLPSPSIGIGGVDPLGLREINFDLMDCVFPGLNNVARHVRPFVVITWAWHRAAEIARRSGLDSVNDQLILDFVDRVDVIYVWSQFIRNPNADLPGRDVIGPIIRSPNWTFGGSDWSARRKTRRLSTALMAPINYGPALKSMGWIERHESYLTVFRPSLAAAPAVAAFERKISKFIDAPALSTFGEVELSKADVASWAEAWALDEPTETEQEVMRMLLMGDGAPAFRQKGCALMLAAGRTIKDEDLYVENVREVMAGAPASFVAPDGLTEAQAMWRKVQVRQLFRLALEALLFWASSQLKDCARTTDFLVTRFIKESGEVTDWLKRANDEADGPTELQERIEAALNNPTGESLPKEVVNALRLCLSEPESTLDPITRPDRLPMARARREAEAWASNASTRDFLRNVFEKWVFAQHVYWSVGRGLADARAGGKTLLRLKVVLEENGWALAPGVNMVARPGLSGDRLRTAFTLADECGLLIGDDDSESQG